MELQNMDLRGGSLQISTEVLGKIARCAALEVAGVAEVSCGSQNRKVKDFLERANVQSPVTVEMRDGTAEIPCISSSHSARASPPWRKRCRKTSKQPSRT